MNFFYNLFHHEQINFLVTNGKNIVTACENDIVIYDTNCKKIYKITNPYKVTNFYNK
jgi:hypothetical protein